SISIWVPLTASAVTATPHGLHSNVSSSNSAWNAVCARCIVSPQHGQTTYSDSCIFERPRTHARPAAGTLLKNIPTCRGTNFQTDGRGGLGGRPSEAVMTGPPIRVDQCERTAALTEDEHE